jgi:spore coat polysaccharide biosynthesis protein SpsF
MKTVDAIIEARMGSSRLPGKVMLKIKNIPIIDLMLQRLKKTKGIRKIILATSINKKDDILENWAKKRKVICYRGSEENVMQRVLLAAKKNKVKHILNLTADCPLIDPFIISQFISIYKSNDCDYLNNCKFRSYPDGMDIQIYPTKILQNSYKFSDTKRLREHVTLHILENEDKYRHLNIISEPRLNFPNLRLTLDDIDDFKLIKKIFIHFFYNKTSFTCLDILSYLKKNKKLFQINKKVKNKIK